MVRRLPERATESWMASTMDLTEAKLLPLRGSRRAEPTVAVSVMVPGLLGRTERVTVYWAELPRSGTAVKMMELPLVMTVEEAERNVTVGGRLLVMRTEVAVAG